MKKIFIIIMTSILIIGSLINCVYANTKKEIKFKDLEWGLTYDEVKEKEITSSMKEHIDYVLYDDMIALLNQNVAGYDCTAVYMFDGNNKLYGGGYNLSEKHTNEQQYYLDFMSLVDKITSIYGEPAGKIENWVGDTFKGRPNKEGIAIVSGELNITVSWLDDNENEIRAVIIGDNGKCNSNLYYLSKDYNDNVSTNTNGL